MDKIISQIINFPKAPMFSMYGPFALNYGLNEKGCFATSTWSPKQVLKQTSPQFCLKYEWYDQPHHTSLFLS